MCQYSILPGMVFADEHDGDMLDHQLEKRHASQAHSIDQSHPALMYNVFSLLEREIVEFRNILNVELSIFFNLIPFKPVTVILCIKPKSL